MDRNELAKDAQDRLDSAIKLFNEGNKDGALNRLFVTIQYIITALQRM